MVVETRSPGRTREIERQLTDSWQRLQASGVVKLVADIANSLSDVEFKLRKEFNEEQPGLAPGITLIGPIEKESRAEIHISAPLGNSRTLRIEGGTRTVASSVSSRTLEWEAEPPIGRGRQIEELILAGVKWAGFVPRR